MNIDVYIQNIIYQNILLTNFDSVLSSAVNFGCSDQGDDASSVIYLACLTVFQVCLFPLV
jgi:hypothetical protein